MDSETWSGDFQSTLNRSAPARPGRSERAPVGNQRAEPRELGRVPEPTLYPVPFLAFLLAEHR